jgi:hypothetical protein
MVSAAIDGRRGDPNRYRDIGLTPIMGTGTSD